MNKYEKKEYTGRSRVTKLMQIRSSIRRNFQLVSKSIKNLILPDQGKADITLKSSVKFTKALRGIKKKTTGSRQRGERGVSQSESPGNIGLLRVN